jgi:hypothetical protein
MHLALFLGHLAPFINTWSKFLFIFVSPQIRTEKTELNNIVFLTAIPKKYHKKSANSIVMQTERWKFKGRGVLEEVIDDGLH